MSHSIFQWEFEITPILSALSAFAVFILGLKVAKAILSLGYAPEDSIHNWKTTTSMQGASCCNACKGLVLDGEGKYCDCCGIHADLSCVVTLNKSLPCKSISVKEEEPMKHHWVRGNLKPMSYCDVCDRECPVSTEMKHFKCCWCLRTVHDKCKVHIAEICDFGRYRSLIVPPSSIRAISKKNTLKKRYIIKTLSPASWSDWTPLFVLANCKSGSNEGEDVLSKFRAFLNPAQVIDLGWKKPEVILECCTLMENVPARILVAGGDGTVGWVLNAILKLDFPVQPAVGIIPLGTGNDLSRVLGWGKGTSGNFSPASILSAISEAETVRFDRWKVEIWPQPNISFRIHSGPRQMFMYNYLSIGVDAQVTLDFHRARESALYVVSSRLLNKLLYLCFGTQQMIEKKCQGLNERLELYLDGKKVELPAIESVVVLNIDSWGAGVNLWRMSEAEHGERSMHGYGDGRLEVVAIYSSLHIAQLQVGLGAPHRVGQASSVEIRLKSSCAVQVDGEPWLQHPARFRIAHFNQALLLKKKCDEHLQ